MSRRKDDLFQNESSKMKSGKSNGDKQNPNRNSLNYQVGYTPQQIKGPTYIKGSRGNSQPPATNDYKVIVPRDEGSYSNKNQSRKNDIKHFEYQQIEEAQKIRDRKERERLLQQYTINQPTGMTVPRNISAFQQQVKFPIQQSQHTHNFVMNQTHNDGGFGVSPNKHQSKNRRQKVMSPALNPYSSAQIHGIDAPINSMSMDHHQKFKSNHTAEKPYSGHKGEYEQISAFNNNRQDQSGSRISGSGRTKTILTTLGVEQQPIQINKKPALNQGQYENLYQAQLNGQIKVYDQQQVSQKIYQTQKNSDSQQRHGLKFEQNFFKGPTSSSNNGSNTSSFLPSIDNTYRVVQPGENYTPGTPNGKKHSKDHDYIIHSSNLKKQQVEHMKLKIGDTTADLHITIQGGNDDDKTPRGHHNKKQKQSKNKSKEVANIQTRIKQMPQQHQGNTNRGPKDKQLDDLNETLQRLAREKAEANHGKNGKIQTVQRKAVRQQYIQENQVPGYQMIEKEYFQDGHELKKKHRKQQSSGGESHTHKYKMEKNQRVQLIMGNDNSMLISQRLQGVKQNMPSTSPNPYPPQSNETAPKTLIEQSMNSSQRQREQPSPSTAPKTVQHIGQKVLKIQKTDIILKKKNTEATEDDGRSFELFPSKEKDQGQQQIQQHSNLRINQAKVRNIIVDTGAPPSFGPDAGNKSQEIQKAADGASSAPQRNISYNQGLKQQEDRFAIIDHSKQKQLENSRAHFQNKRSMENPIIPNLYLHTENRFSSVIEDVENEQLKSPTTRGSKLSLTKQQQKIQAREHKERQDKEPIRGSQENPLRGENKMKVIQFLGHKRRESNGGQQRNDFEDITRNSQQQQKQTNTFSVPSQPQINNAEQLMESRDDLDDDPLMFQTRKGVIISSLEMKDQKANENDTPEGSRSRRGNEGKKSPQRETNYSQIFSLQTGKLEQNQQYEPSATLGKDVLSQALKPPPGPSKLVPKNNSQTDRNADNKRYSSNIATKRQSPIRLDVEPRSPTAHSNGSVEQRKNQFVDYASKGHAPSRAEKGQTKHQSSKMNQLRDSKESNKSGSRKAQILVPAQRTQQIYTPRVAASGGIGDPLERVSAKFGASQSPQARGAGQTRAENSQATFQQPAINNHQSKRNQHKLHTQQAENNAPATGIGGEGDASYLPSIDQRAPGKSPARGSGAPRPPVAPATQRAENSAHVAQKLSTMTVQKPSKRRQQLQQSPQKAQKVAAPAKVEADLEDSTDGDEKVKRLRLGVPVKSKKDSCSYCQEYIQYRGVQIPKKWRELFTHNKFRKVEGGPVWSQRLFMSRECAQSEDRRMMPIMIINLDGALGFWDDASKHHYVLRQKAVESLITLSHDFRLVAVSSQQQKLIFKLVHGLMNMPGQDEQGHVDTNQLRHLYFDAVYQLQSTNEDRKFQSTQKNIDNIHFDLTQVLLDMQFKRQKSASKKEEQIEQEGAAQEENFQTFWESDQYRPHQKVLIFTTEQYLNKNHCYSFDYNYLYQASRFSNEHSKKSPIVIQMPHLRVNPKLTFEVVHQLIFTLQYISHAVHLQTQANHLIINGKLFENPEISSFEVCKKLLSAKWRQQETKMRQNGNLKGLRVFDSDNDPYVNLENINFSESYKFLKKYFQHKPSNWLRIQKYYLKTRPSKQDKIQKMKLIAKVTFNDSPEIIRMGEDNGSQITKAIGTTHDSSKAESIKESKTTMYMSDDAKNLYNGLMIRNFKLQQEINSYARHHRIQNQAKQAHLKLMENKNEAAQRPIVIFDGDKEQEKPRSSLKQYTGAKSSIRDGESKDKIAAIQAPAKAYAFKYRALIIKSGEIYEQWQCNDCDFSKYQVVNLRVKVNQASFERCIAGVPQAANASQPAHQLQQQVAHQNIPKVALDKPSKTSLLDYLCKRQTRINYTTSQEMHLKNNLSQLVEGKQQYADQQKELQDQDKEAVAEQLPNINPKDNKPESYIDGL